MLDASLTVLSNWIASALVLPLHAVRTIVVAAVDAVVVVGYIVVKSMTLLEMERSE